jgi:hypothetical protein
LTIPKVSKRRIFPKSRSIKIIDFCPQKLTKSDKKEQLRHFHNLILYILSCFLFFHLYPFFVNWVFLIDSRFLRKNFIILLFVHTNENIVERLIFNLSPSSGPGHSEIPSKLIKFASNIVAPILTKLFNHCIDIGKFPVEWKSAIVTPLYKNKGQTNDFNNYRGNSILPPIAKIFEKILASEISIYLSLNNILFSGQHGFRNGHSCETALHELISGLNKNRDSRLINLLLFIDFRKAFDLVDARKLLRKLFHYGFDNTALNLIANYFTDRNQTIKFNKKKLPLMSIRLGVPQGSELGPLFFLIFINDLAFLLKFCCKMFADDTTLYDADKDFKTLVKRFVKKIGITP